MVQIRRPRSKAEWKGLFELRFEILHRRLGAPRETSALHNKGDYYLIAISGKRVVGTAMLAFEGKKGRVGYVAVDRAARHKRIGSALVKKLEKKAREKRLQRLYVNSRRPAVKFFRQIGFKRAGDFFGHRKLGTLHVRMEKKLDG